LQLLEWNNHSASSRLAEHHKNRTLRPVQLRFLGLFAQLVKKSKPLSEHNSMSEWLRNISILTWNLPINQQITIVLSKSKHLLKWLSRRKLNVEKNFTLAVNPDL
jgi:hypothetical protein